MRYLLPLATPTHKFQAKPHHHILRATTTTSSTPEKCPHPCISESLIPHPTVPAPSRLISANDAKNFLQVQDLLVSDFNSDADSDSRRLVQ
ncbi:hypothetical protein BofuT4_uP036390.1 [Botrytis cinerea T4]|uniref:Uncharacterized protein n=1 Tax=Botryotinia fuckeliana (strain T4) TaxID=999810 RepID=G2Y4R9_BOTF4|nr:hypothetical protein BofuT4_uP036390.1 [Botrytis cinerea T4]